MLTISGEGGEERVQEPLVLADVICEQPLIDVKCYYNNDHVGIDHHRMDVLLPEKAPKVGHSMFLMNVFLSNTLNPLSLPFVSISS